MKKSLYNYLFRSSASVRESLLKLTNLSNKTSPLSAGQADILSHVNLLLPFLEEPVDEKVWQSEQSIISLVEADKLDRFIKNIENTGGISDQGQEAEKELLVQLEIVVQIVASKNLQPLYSSVQVEHLLFDGQVHINVGDVARSIYALQFVDKEWPDLIKTALKYLREVWPSKKNNLEWDELVVGALLVGVLYYHFNRLSETNKAFLLQNNFFSALFVGIPVKNVLSGQLLACEWTVSYINLNISLSVLLENSSELIAVLDSSWAGKNFGEIAKQFRKNTNGAVFDEKECMDFVNNITTHNKSSGIKGALVKALEIYTKIKQANLVDWLGDHPLMHDEEHEADLLKLYTYFLIEEKYVRMVEYFKNKPFFTSRDFLRHLSLQVDLTKEDVLQNCLRLIGVLKDTQLVPADVDYLEFHEQDNSFYWNRQLLA